MDTKFTIDNLTERKIIIESEIKAILEKSEPIRVKRDKFVQDHDNARKIMDEELRMSEKGLFDLRNEHGMIARALGGKLLKVVR